MGEKIENNFEYRETKEKEKTINVKILDMICGTEEPFYKKRALIFEDCAYEDLKGYIVAEVNPFLEGKEPLKHQLTSKDVENLIEEGYNSYDSYALVGLGARIVPEKMENLYKAFEDVVRSALIQVIVGNPRHRNALSPGIVENYLFLPRDTKEKLMEILKKYDPKSKEENEAKKMVKRAKENPQEFISEFIKGIPIDNALKSFIAIEDFIVGNKDRLNKNIITQEIQKLDQEKYPDKTEFINIVETCFLEK